MEVQELQSKLEEFRPFIVVHGKEIDKDNEKVKEFIEIYYELTGKRVGEGTCRNCIFDAYMELSIKTKEQLKRLVMPCKFKLLKGRVVVFNNTDYTNANITDEVAMKMIAFNSKHAGNFENPHEVLAAYASSHTGKGTETIIKVEKEPKTEATEENVNAIMDSVLDLEELKRKYEAAKGKKPHWKWNAEKILEKLNED